jgi:glyceraldehyde 3-phosphate dehydrogenase
MAQSKKYKVAINGFGRIGKQFFLACLEEKVDWEFIINELTELDAIVYTLKHDSVHKPIEGEVKHDGKFLYVGKKKIKMINEMNVEKLPWKEENIDLVVDCTGLFTKAEDAKKHIAAGAKRVLISAPAKGHDCTIVYGINNSALKKEHKIISAGSCTTNCVAPMAKIINDKFGIKAAHFVTTHAMTATQKLIDTYGKKDYRGGRAASINIVPSTSGASISVVEVIPQLKGKLEGYALRVPVVDGSITSLFAKVEKPATVKEVKDLFKNKSSTDMKGILEYTDEQLVSCDIVNNPASCIFDSELVKVVDDTISIAGWYDNEYGYSHRLANVAGLVLNLK